MKFTKLAITLLVGSVLFCGCTKDNSIAIKVNDKAMTKKEFYSNYEKIKNSQLKGAPKEIQKETSYPSLTIKNRFVEQSVVKLLLDQEFEKRKITASEEEIKAKKEEIIAQMGSVEIFNNVVKENNISEEQINSDMAMEVKVDKLFNAIKDGEITDSRVEKYYKEHKAEFNTPETVQASHILINTNKESIKREIVSADTEGKLSRADIDKKVEEQVKKAQELANEVRKKAVANPKNFAQLAKEYSQDKGSAQRGGDLGYILKDQVVPEFAKAAFSQKVGTISPLVVSQFGTHIIYVKDKAKAGMQPLSAVKADLKKYLEIEQKRNSMQKLIDGLKSSAKIEYVDEKLNPENLKKEINEALEKQIQLEMKMANPKAKAGIFDKAKKEKEKK